MLFSWQIWINNLAVGTPIVPSRLPAILVLRTDKMGWGSGVYDGIIFYLDVEGDGGHGFSFTHPILSRASSQLTYTSSYPTNLIFISFYNKPLFFFIYFFLKLQKTFINIIITVYWLVALNVRNKLRRGMGVILNRVLYNA